MSTGMRRMCSNCCASAVNGQTAVEPTTTLMKPRRRIASPRGSGQGIVAGQTGRLEVDKTALGDVRFGSKADITLLSFRDVSRRPEWLAGGAGIILPRLP